MLFFFIIYLSICLLLSLYLFCYFFLIIINHRFFVFKQYRYKREWIVITNLPFIMSFFLMFYLFKEFDFVFFLCNLVMIIFATLIILIYLLLPHFLKQKYKLSEFLKIDFEKLIKNCNIDFKKEEIKKILLCQNTRYCKLYEEYAFLTSLVTDYKKNSYVAILEKIIKFNDKVKLLNHRYNAIIYKLSLYLYFDLQKIHKNALN